MLMTVPSGFYETLSGIENLRVTAVCMGVRRSATTAIYQIVRDAIPEGGVIKTHSWLDVPLDVPIILSYRDFRDCAASWWRIMRQERLERNAKHVAHLLSSACSFAIVILNLPANSPQRMSLEDAVNHANLIKMDVTNMEAYQHGSRPLVLLRYEEFVNNPTALAKSLSTVLSRKVTPEMCAAHDLKHNWGLKRFEDIVVPGWNADAAKGPIEGGHCHGGEYAIWKPFCDARVGGRLNDELRDVLVKYNYVKAEG